jgi:CRP/FNR family transcriptional regulator, cyclic AMP receptor protein
MDLKAVMKRVELFQGLNDVQLDQIMKIGHQDVSDVGAVIVAQGSEGEAMYVVGKGQVEIQIESESGSKYLAVYLGEGQVFGEMALIDKGKRSASVVVAEDETVIIRLAADDFISLCSVDTAIGFILMRNLAQDLSFKLRHQNL